MHINQAVMFAILTQMLYQAKNSYFSAIIQSNRRLTHQHFITFKVFKYIFQ